MLSWQRSIYYLGLALVEATPVALLLTIAGGDAWGLLIGVVLLGALADWVGLRRVAPAGARLTGPTAVAASTEVLAFFAIGLATIALASGINEQDVGLHRLGWRGMLIVCGAIGGMLGLGVLLGALFGRDIALIVRTLWQA